MSDPIFPFDPKRAAALAEHLDCPVEEIVIVKGRGTHVYTRLEPGQDQDEAEAENGRWHVIPGDDEFDRLTEAHVAESLYTYNAEAINDATFPNDNFKLLLRRAVGLWQGKGPNEKPPALDVAVAYGLPNPKDVEDIDLQDPCAIMVALGRNDNDLVPLLDLCISPKPNTNELNAALKKVVDVARLVEIHRDESGYAGVWSCAEYESVTVDGDDETYHLLREEG